LGEINEIGKSISVALDRPRGRLRISAPQLFAHVALARLVAEFIRIHPDVRIEVTAEDRPVDLVEEDYDLAIRTNPQPNASLVGRCFLRDQILLVAAPSLECPPPGRERKAPVPVRAVMLMTAPESSIWRVTESNRERTFMPEVVLRLSSLLMVRDAVRASGGAALLPLSIVADDLAAGRLIRWGTVTDQHPEVWVLHTSRRLVSSKVSVFVRFLCDSFPDAVLR
jgi:DNA-binding transcriptional LysR family regulator